MKFKVLKVLEMLKIKISCFKVSDVVFILLINVKIPKSVGILSFMSMINIRLSSVGHEKSFIIFGGLYSMRSSERSLQGGYLGLMSVLTHV